MNKFKHKKKFSIGVNPLLPLLCVNEKKTRKKFSKSLIDLSVFMNTLSCGINIKHEQIAILPPLMSLVRNYFKINKLF